MSYIDATLILQYTPTHIHTAYLIVHGSDHDYESFNTNSCTVVILFGDNIIIIINNTDRRTCCQYYALLRCCAFTVITRRLNYCNCNDASSEQLHQPPYLFINFMNQQHCTIINKSQNSQLVILLVTKRHSTLEQQHYEL